jgi:hypothetical protein
MVQTDCNLQSHSADQGGQLGWHVCTDDILASVKGIAMKENSNSIRAMAKARELVGFFSNSSQAEEILLSKQAEGKVVRCIQDVFTCWWLTYSMCYVCYGYSIIFQLCK